MIQIQETKANPSASEFVLKYMSKIVEYHNASNTGKNKKTRTVCTYHGMYCINLKYFTCIRWHRRLVWGFSPLSRPHTFVFSDRLIMHKIYFTGHKIRSRFLCQNGVAVVVKWRRKGTQMHADLTKCLHVMNSCNSRPSIDNYSGVFLLRRN